MLTKAIYEKCDALDGPKDGLIDDPRTGKFDPAKDLPAGVFSASQIDGLKKIYSGPLDSQGKQVFPGELVGAEPVWPDNVIPPSKTVLPKSESQAKMMMLEPPPGPEGSFTMFNWDTDPARLAKAAADLNPRNPDLTPLKKRGSKMVQYAGLGRSASESPAPASNTTRLFEEARGRRDPRVLPAVHGAGDVSLQRRPGMRFG